MTAVPETQPPVSKLDGTTPTKAVHARVDVLQFLDAVREPVRTTFFSSRSPFTIVVPSRNEEDSIGAVLAGVRALTDDLIVVDGHSSDATVTIAQSLGARVLQDHGRGKGDAIRVGLAAARHPITVFIDADGSHDPQDIPRLVEPISTGEADLVMGSRMLGGSDELFGTLSEATRMFGQLIISLSINYRFGVRLTDYENGFRAIRTDVGLAIGLTSDAATIEQEMAMKCLKAGYRVTERPTHEYRRQGGVSKINVLQVGHSFVISLVTGLIGRRSPRPPDCPLAPALPSSPAVRVSASGAW